MVDGDKSCPSMLYESMDRCKEAIQRALNNVDAKYMEMWETVDSKWKMMHAPLHAAACYLEPKLFHIDRQGNFEIMAGFHEAISKFELDPTIASLISDQGWVYKRAEGLFGIAGAKYDMTRDVQATPHLLQKQCIPKDIEVSVADEPDFLDEELDSDTDDDATPSEPSALDDLELF
ncbi:hypothetical protein SUGI_0828640 [Cryptomeria japonica]|nr:hypothetical protein SUGI_0828640 [Cryptomeria japonica]